VIALVSVQFILADHSAGLDDFSNLMTEMSKLAAQWYTPSDCPFVRSAFLDIVSLCGMTMLRRQGSTAILHAWEELTASVSIGPQYAIGARRATGDDLLRQSLAQVFFIDRVILRDNSLRQMVSKDYQGIGDALMLLAIKDQDTCCTALDTLDNILNLNPPSGITIPLDLVLSHIHLVLLTTTSSEVTSRAQSVLAHSFISPTLQTAFFALLTESSVLATLTLLESQCLTGPPSNMQSGLLLLGTFLDYAYKSYAAQRGDILAATTRYIRLLRMTIIDTNPFDMRFAAVSSLGALTHMWCMSTSSKTTGPVLLALTLVLYDMLNDDDDEIRDVAALATTKLFVAQNFRRGGKESTVPMLTTHRLAHFLATRFYNSIHLASEALSRLASPSIPFGRVLQDARREDTSLFATEKQNLYKDDSLDAVLWSRVLSCITIPATKHLQLKAWVLDALHVLTTTAEQEVDGALGWSSKSEVFTLGIRVFCAAEVVLDGEIMLALGRFMEKARGGEVHGLWVEKVEKVLEKGVLGMMRRVKGSFEKELKL
jgi:hypothetical protein